jgi:predicted unusual protein kinase regulating ubiquinone biosynthesis (AarF/ABC1/UbiB family)
MATGPIVESVETQTLLAGEPMSSQLTEGSQRLAVWRLVVLVFNAWRVMAGYVWDRIRRRGEDTDALVARRTRQAFERLGPTFVKLGQLISSSPGSVSAGWIDEMASCRDHVPPVPWPVIERVIEQELGARARLLIDIDHRPLAAGSMAQVHAARLTDGTEVVVKVQRPGLERLLLQDLRLLRTTARWMVRIHPSLKAINPVGLVEDFALSVGQQLSFRTEIANLFALRRAVRACPVIVPRVWMSMSSERLLVMERQFGVGIDDPTALDALGVDRRRVLESLVGSLLVSAMGDGTFHGDLHAGNMLVRSDGRLVLLDFGVVGRLDAKARAAVAQLLGALAELRFDAAALALLQLVDTTSTDLSAAARDVQGLIAGLMSGSVRDIDVANALGQLLRTATAHQLVLPQGVVAFFKQLMFLDGISRTLDPDYNLFTDGTALFEKTLRPGEPAGPRTKPARAGDACLAQLRRGRCERILPGTNARAARGCTAGKEMAL